LLKKHKRGLKYSFSHCKYQSTCSSHVRNHVRVQHEGAVFPCEQCKYQVPNKYGFRKHKRSRHEGANGKFECIICGYISRIENATRVHKRGKHAVTIVVQENILPLNTVIPRAKKRLKPGNNVFVTIDKTKLKEREMYKVIEVFLKNDEEDLQENFDPDTQYNKAGNTAVEVLGPQPSSDLIENVYNTVRKDANHEPIKDETNNSQDKCPRRSATTRNGGNIRETIITGTLKVNKTNIPKPPSHAWGWRTFKDLIDDDGDTSVSFTFDPGIESVSREENSPGTCSPLVNYTPLSPTQPSTNSQQNLNNHIKKVHERSRFFCDQCEESFQFTCKLARHIESKHEKKRFTCDLCSISYTRSSYEDHNKTVHSGKRFACDQCERLFFKRNVLEEHRMRKHEKARVQCDECPTDYSMKSGLRDCKKNKHTGVNFECEACGKKFPQKSILEDRTQKHSLDKHVVITHDGNSGTYSCRICDAVSKDERSLKAHTEVNHEHKRFQCYDCDKYFSRSADLSTHFKTLMEGKPICEVCGKGFSRQSSPSLFSMISGHFLVQKVDLSKMDITVKDILTTMSCLPEACKLMSVEGGDKAPKCRGTYYFYDEALLELAGLENVVLGNAFSRVPDDDEATKDDFKKKVMDIDDEEKDEVRSQENSGHDTQHSKADNVAIEVPRPQPSSDISEDVYNPVRKEADHEHIKEEANTYCDRYPLQFLSEHILNTKKKRQHRISEKNEIVECKLCHIKSKQQTDLNSHYSNAHKNDEMLEKEITEADLKFKYDKCELRFVGEDYMKGHLQKHENTRFDFLSNEAFDEAKQAFKCKLCYTQFVKQELLKAHEESVHKFDTELFSGEIKEEELIFPCIICNLAFPYARDQAYHAGKMHGAPKPDGTFKDCLECEKWFRTKGELTQHTARMHNLKSEQQAVLQEMVEHWSNRSEGEKMENFIENDVSSLFSVILGHFLVQKDDLPKVDTTVKDIFQCNECDETFSYELVMKKHMSKHVQPMKCDICEKMFSFAEYIEEHKKTHHAATEVLNKHFGRK